MGTARGGFTATLVQDGQVLVACDDEAGAVTSSAELYNPVTGMWAVTGNRGRRPRLTEGVKA